MHKAQKVGMWSAWTTSVRPLAWVLVWLVAGAALAALTWRPGVAPVGSIALPIGLALALRRSHAFAFAWGYYAALLRFMPALAAGWFEGSELDQPGSPLAWSLLAITLLAAFWNLFWTASRSSRRVAALSALAFVATLAPPLGAVVVGHPLVGWASLMFSHLGWFGVVLAVVASSVLCALARDLALDPLHVQTPMADGFQDKARAWAWRAAPGVVGAVFLVLAGQIQYVAPKRSVADGDITSVMTQYGRPPTTDEAIIQRVEAAGRVVRALARVDGGAPRIVVFPEGMLGTYDTTFAAVMRLEVERPARASGQAVVIGAELRTPQGNRRNVALVIRADGTNTTVPMRQPVPITLWRPWDSANHNRSDWGAATLVQFGPSLRGRIMICFELMLPMMHLLSESEGPHEVVLGLANLWTDHSGLAQAVQYAHAQPMAKLFGKPLVIAANTPKR